MRETADTNNQSKATPDGIMDEKRKEPTHTHHDEERYRLPASSSFTVDRSHVCCHVSYLPEQYQKNTPTPNPPTPHPLSYFFLLKGLCGVSLNFTFPGVFVAPTTHRQLNRQFAAPHFFKTMSSTPSGLFNSSFPSST